MKLGVFDSGVGGEAVAAELRRLIPDAMVISINDSKNVPYGGRPRAEIMKLTKAAIQPLIDMQCDAIVIACNTATTNAIQLLRHDFPTTKFIGLEPMIKPAALLSKTKRVAILATPATLTSPRYQELKKLYGQGITFVEPDCATWATLIEAKREHEIPLEDTIRQLTSTAVDVIVLGCTHYHWIKPAIQAIIDDELVAVLEPSEAIKNRIIEIVS
jgi:glutamate racemase